MPAITPASILTLPRITRPDEATAQYRPALKVVRTPKFMEGAGFQVRRPFPGVNAIDSDPFLLLDHLGAVECAPGEAKGAPWHPHRGFETVTYIIDGATAHHGAMGG